MGSKLWLLKKWFWVFKRTKEGVVLGLKKKKKKSELMGIVFFFFFFSLAIFRLGRKPGNRSLMSHWPIMTNE